MIGPGKMLKQLIESLFAKPATQLYPFVKTEPPKNLRGRIMFRHESCIGCKFCMKDCPSNAIIITRKPDGKFECAIDLGKCIYCAQCVDSCPKKALDSTREFELAVIDREKLKTTFNADKKPEDTSR